MFIFNISDQASTNSHFAVVHFVPELYSLSLILNKQFEQTISLFQY
jgi:hypothetical protein